MDLTNGTDGGDGFSGNHSEKTKKKMSLSHQTEHYINSRKIYKLKGSWSKENNGFFGKKHSEESKKKISLRKKGHLLGIKEKNFQKNIKIIFVLLGLNGNKIF